MKKISLYFLAVVLLCAACAKTPVTPSNAAAKAWFDAWVVSNDDGSWEETPLGCYIMEDEPGTGAVIQSDTTENHYLWVEYVATTLRGSACALSETGSQRAAPETRPVRIIRM